MTDTSVIITTYNRPDALALVLEGFLHQEGAEPFEIVVADDGSGPETKEVVETFADKAPFRVDHAWQPDEGFRAAAVRNLGFRHARGERIIYADGDCIPFPDFVAAHQKVITGPGRCLVGKRCFLTKEETDRFTAAMVTDRSIFEKTFARERGRLRKRFWKNRFYRWTRLKERPKLLTANASVHRADFERVNGLDERYVGWGQEDDDLGRRLRWAGTDVRDGALSARVLHLDHPAQESFDHKIKNGPNYGYFHRGYTLTRCTHGLVSRTAADWKLRVPDPLPDALSDLRDWADAPSDAEHLGPDAYEVAILAPTESPGRIEAEIRVLLHLPTNDPPAGSLLKRVDLLLDCSGTGDSLDATCGAAGCVRLDAGSIESPDIGNRIRSLLEGEI